MPATDDIRFDLPIVESDTAPWWTAIADGRLLAESCGSCGDLHLYPRGFCPVCWSDDVAITEMSGRATLYSFSIVRVNDLPPFGQRVPYVVGIAELEEGPRLMTNVVEIDPDEVRIGMPIAFRPRDLGDGIAAPDFVPAAEVGHAA